VESSKTGNGDTTDALLQISYRSALQKERNTVVETLLEPHAVEMVTCVLGAGSKKKQTVQLSNSTVKRRIQDLSADTKKRVLSGLTSKLSFSVATSRLARRARAEHCYSCLYVTPSEHKIGEDFAVRMCSAQTSSLSSQLSARSCIGRAFAHRLNVVHN
jgi:hypothetical protein